MNSVASLELSSKSEDSLQNSDGEWKLPLTLGTQRTCECKANHINSSRLLSSAAKKHFPLLETLQIEKNQTQFVTKLD